LKVRFTQRHVRSSVSYGFGAATPEELVEVLTRLNMNSLATSGKYSGQGLPRFLKTADKRGVCPVASAETHNGGQST
jgi:DNA polymerase III alpha subunit